VIRSWAPGKLRASRSFRFSSVDLLKVCSWPLLINTTINDSDGVALSPVFPVDRSSEDELGWAVHFAKYWLKDCTEKHLLCNSGRVSEFMPTRLLELNAPQIGFFRIIHTRQTETSRIVPYTTLSHCWGKIDLLKLSNQTEGQLRAGVSNLVLPQTFQDAIQVSLTIGVNYLWIDFLCIYQDSSSDWDKESGLMGAVYSNSVLNIAATSARDGNGGLFSKRRLALYQGCRVQSLWTDTTNREWLVQPATIERLLLDGPLLYRGWVIQERFLAPRVLHFGATGLYWECRQRDACLSYPDGISGDTLKFRFKSLYEKLQVPSDKFDSMVHYTENILHAWGVFVMYYTECDLSMEKDKLVAISGVAKVFQIKCGGMEYLAGLWRQNLVQTLCWYLWNPGRRPQEYRAPSWAWASIEGPVTLKSNISGNRDLAQIVEVSVEHKTSDVTGEVKGGLIRLQGYLMTIVSNTRGSVAILTVNGTSNACHFYCRDTVVDGKKLHCMPMVQWLDGETAECLVLEPVDSIRGKFRRYGFMWLSYDDFGIESWDKIQNEDWIEFEADTRDGKYTISII
jgi:hypothetical protein